jgi:hypothetical protein
LRILLGKRWRRLGRRFGRPGAKAVAATRVVVADEESIIHFSLCASPLLGKIAKSERESRTLAALRDILLPQVDFQQDAPEKYRNPDETTPKTRNAQ